MDIKKLHTIIRKNLCPRCNIGAARDTAGRVYVCDYAKCGEVFDFSFLSDTMIRRLLDGDGSQKRE